MEQPTQARRLFTGRHAAQTIQPGIQPAPSANGAIGEFRQQATIKPREGLPPQHSFQRHIGIGTCSHGFQHLPCQPPRRQTHSRRIGARG